MSVENKNGSLFWATGIDTSGMYSDAERAKAIIKDLSSDIKKDGSQMESSIKGVGSALAALGGTAAIGMIGKEILDTTAKFEKFGIVLKNTLGDVEGAAALDMIAEFAATTPFQLDEVTAAFIKMANQGFVPTRSELVKLGDLASSTGKSFDQLTEALLDAQTGQFERLKEFGIKASANGDKVTFSFKEQQTTVDNTNSAIQAYMLSLGDLQGVQGANAKISESLTGQLSNLQDKLEAMYNTVGSANSGVLYASVEIASTLIENYETVGKVILGLVGVYGAYRAGLIMANVAEQVSIANKALTVAADAGLIAANTTLTASEIAKMAAVEAGTVAQRIMNATMLANPYVAAAVAVAALAAGIYVLATHTTAAEKSHEKLHDTINETNGSIAAENIQIDTLFARLKAAKKGSEDYQAAKDEIIKKYGSYLTGLDKEVQSLNDVAAAYDAIRKSASDASKARALDKATQQAADDFTKSTEENLKDLQELLASKYGKDSKKSIELFYQLKPIIEGEKNVKINDDFLKQFDFKRVVGGGGYGAEVITNQLQDIVDKSVDAKNAYKGVVDEAYKYLGGTTAKSTKEDDKKDVVSETPAQIKARLAAEKRAKEVKDKLNSSKASGEYEANKDLQSLLIDLQNQTANLLIKNSEENLQTRLAQIELEKQAEIQKITDKEISIVEAYNKSHKGDRGFKSLSTKQAELQASLQTINPDLAKQLQTATTGVVAAYGQKSKQETKKWNDEILDLAREFADKRVQIAYDYNEKISKLEGLGKKNAANAARKERDKAISDETMSIIENTQLYKTASDERLNISKVTSEQLLDDLRQRLVDEWAAGNLSVDQMNELIDKVNTAQKAVSDKKNENNPFAQLGSAISGQKTAKADYNAALADPSKTTDDLAALESAANESTKAMAGAAGAALMGVQSILQSVVGGLDELGLLTEDQKKNADDVMGMVGGAANIAMGIATGNPMAIIQGSIDLLVSGYKLFDTRTKDAEKTISEMSDKVDRLKDSYNDLSDAIDDAFSTKKAGMIKEQIANLQEQNAAIQKQIEAENSKKNPDDTALKEYQDQIKENNKLIQDQKDSWIEALTGTDVMSAVDSFAQAYADAWISGENAAKKSTEVVKGIIRNGLIEYMKGKLQPEVESLMNSIATAMTDGSISKSEQAAIDILTNSLDAKAAQYKTALDPYLESSTKSGVTGELKSAMTEGTGSQLVGLWNMTAMDIRWIREWLAAMNSGGNTAITNDVGTLLNVVISNTWLIQQHTQRTADGVVYIAGILNQVLYSNNNSNNNNNNNSKYPNTSRSTEL